MAHLITAPVGTGKTLKCIELIFEYLNQGRPVYTNIVGLKIPGVFCIESTLQNPYDWRDQPNEAVLIYDEAHEHPAFSERDLLKNLKIDFYEQELKRIYSLEDISDTKRKSLIAETEKAYSRALKDKKEQILDIGLSMSMHRHFGQEIILVTQNPTKLNKDVLGNITIHYVMRRKFGAEAAVIWTFGEAMTTWGKSVAEGALNKEIWKFPKHLYKFYVSSEKHNVKKYFPKKYYAFALIPLLLFGKGYLNAKETGFFGLMGNDKNTQVSNVASDPSVPVPDSDDVGYEIVKVSSTGETESELLAKQRSDFNPDIECRKAENLQLPACINWFNQLSSNNYSALPNGQVMQTFEYDPYKPYEVEYKPQIQPRDFPKMSGVMTMRDGRLMAVDQQGNYMPQISQDDCRRWLNGYRPFDYTRENNRGQQYAVTSPVPTQTSNSQPSEQSIQEI